MKKNKAYVLMLAALGWVSCLTMSSHAADAPVIEAPPEPFALVELFTSEGCSSCPPADELLVQLSEAARAQGQRLFTLSYHVDYWNDLGWRDPFSDPQFSVRQKKYAQYFRANDVYTPQMVVNGREGFNGARKDLAKQAIDQAFQTPALVELRISAARTKKGIRIQYQSSSAPANTYLQIAVTEPGRISTVERGENAGKTLRHASVVRIFKSMFLTNPKGTIELSLSGPLSTTGLELVMFLQDANDMTVKTAAMAEIPPSER